jgi:hypothetical protein
MSTMKLEAKTVQVLKNFSTINPSMLFKPGNVLATVSPTRSVLAKARIGQQFEKQFAIYDLSRFLSVMSLFENPDIELNDQSATIRSNDRELDYRYADPSTIIAPPDKDLNLPSDDVSFTLTAANLADIQRALSALGMPEIAVVGDRKKIWLQVTDSKNSQGDSYKITLGTTTKKFKLVFKAENLKLIPQDYNVRITSKGISHFKGSSVVDVDYWITLEAKASSYED